MKSVVTSWPTVPPPIPPPPRQGEITQKTGLSGWQSCEPAWQYFADFTPKLRTAFINVILRNEIRKQGAWERRRLLDQKQSIRIYLQPHSNHCQKNRTIWWLLLQDNWFQLIFNCCNFYGCCIYTFLWMLYIYISMNVCCEYFYLRSL